LVVLRPLEANCLEAGPRLARPDLQLAVLVAAGHGELPKLNIWVVVAVIIQEEQRGEWFSFVRFPVMKTSWRSLPQHVNLEELDLPVLRGSGQSCTVRREGCV
jgi:hypothetical protein